MVGFLTVVTILTFV